MAGGSFDLGLAWSFASELNNLRCHGWNSNWFRGKRLGFRSRFLGWKCPTRTPNYPISAASLFFIHSLGEFDLKRALATNLQKNALLPMQSCPLAGRICFQPAQERWSANRRADHLWIQWSGPWDIPKTSVNALDSISLQVRVASPRWRCSLLPPVGSLHFLGDIGFQPWPSLAMRHPGNGHLHQLGWTFIALIDL